MSGLVKWDPRDYYDAVHVWPLGDLLAYLMIKGVTHKANQIERASAEALRKLGGQTH